MSTGGENSAASRPWDEFFFSREGTSRSQQYSAHAVRTSWEIQNAVGAEQYSEVGGGRSARDNPSSAVAEARQRNLVNLAEQNVAGTMSSSSVAADEGLSSWTASISHLLNDGVSPVDFDALCSGLPSTARYHSPAGGDHGECNWEGDGDCGSSSPPTARKLQYQTALTPGVFTTKQTRDTSNVSVSEEHSTLSNPRLATTSSQTPATPNTPSASRAVVDPSPMDAGGRYVTVGSCNRTLSEVDEYVPGVTGGSTGGDFVSLPPMRYDSPLEMEADVGRGEGAKGELLESCSTQDHAARSRLESRLTELAQDFRYDGGGDGYRGVRPFGFGSEEKVESSRDGATNVAGGLAGPGNKVRGGGFGSGLEPQSWKKAEGQVSLVVSGPRRLEVRSSASSSGVAPMAQSTNDGGSSVESPFDIGSRFSTPLSSPARKLADGEGKEEEDDVELGATLKAWTSAKKAGKRREHESLNVSFESGNANGNSATSLAALQQVVYGKSHQQAKAAAAASQYVASNATAKQSNVARRDSTTKKTPSTAVWQPAPMARQPVSPPHYLDLNASVASATESEAWGVDVEQEYFVAQLAKHIARKLHMRVSKTPPASDAGGGPATPSPSEPRYCSTGHNGTLSEAWQAKFAHRLDDDGSDGDIDLVIDLANVGETKKSREKSVAKGTGKVGRRRKKGAKGAIPTKKAVVGDSGGEGKYTMRCSPCKKETFTRWVFARELVAYKAVAAAVTPGGDTIYVSIYDGTTCYRIGQEAFNSARGYFVYLNAEAAAEKPVPSKAKSVVDRFPRLILKVLVSGRGYQQANSYSFPVMRPVAVMYPDDVVGKYCKQVPDFHSAMQHVDKGNVLQSLRKLAVAAAPPAPTTTATTPAAKQKNKSAAARPAPTSRQADLMRSLHGCLDAVVNANAY